MNGSASVPASTVGTMSSSSEDLGISFSDGEDTLPTSMLSKALGRVKVIEKIVSGGQTGVDRAALDVALRHAFPCGGWCPKGRLAEDGPLSPSYPLRETATAVYAERTKLNVRDSDGTLVLSPTPPSGGTALTIEYARAEDRPCLVLTLGPGARSGPILYWAGTHRIRVLNVAGPRESTVPGVYEQAAALMEALLTEMA